MPATPGIAAPANWGSPAVCRYSVYPCRSGVCPDIDLTVPAGDDAWVPSVRIPELGEPPSMPAPRAKPAPGPDASAGGADGKRAAAAGRTGTAMTGARSTGEVGGLVVATAAANATRRIEDRLGLGCPAAERGPGHGIRLGFRRRGQIGANGLPEPRNDLVRVPPVAAVVADL